MTDEKNKKKFYERLHNLNILPDGNLNSINTIDIVNLKIENPPPEDENQENAPSI